MLALASLLVLVSAFSAGAAPLLFDEFVVAWPAKQIAAGRVPYRDFLCFTPPVPLYGMAAIYWLFGASLAAQRVVQIGPLVVSTVLLAEGLARAGMARGWAALAGFALPGLFVVFWPSPSHHWFAGGLGVAALVVAFGAEQRSWRWFAAGLLGSLTGLCLQSEGLIIGVLTLTLAVGAPATTRSRAVLGLAIGFVVPVAGVAIAAAAGTLGDPWFSLVAWPARYYRREGGFNDVDPVAFVLGQLGRNVPTAARRNEVVQFALHILALSLFALGVVSAAVDLVRLRRREARASAAWGVLGMAVLAWIYLHGRSDWTPLMFLGPFVLIVVARAIDWRTERARPALVKGWVATMIALALAHGVPTWAESLPDPARVAAIDDEASRNGPARVLDLLPGAEAGRATILYLPFGGPLYFFWAPTPPPFSWIDPPTSGGENPEYARFAEFALRERVPFILIAPSFEQPFVERPSPVADLLRQHYRRLRDTRFGVVFARVEGQILNP
ncbi:MAG: hypothetical protein EXR72_23470 [Myxococcales bacterium]|nr:hypothetical protein [Myxococcales bacterium]